MIFIQHTYSENKTAIMRPRISGYPVKLTHVLVELIWNYGIYL